MSNAWTKGSPNMGSGNAKWGSGARGGGRGGGGAAAASSSSPPAGAGGGRMKYVPPPSSAAAAGSPSSVSPPGKMKYVAPPTNAGEWNRPKVTAGGTCQWKELAAAEEAKIKASKKIARSETKQKCSVGMSGNDRADIAATQFEFDLWQKKDVNITLAWCRAEECRIPNKRVARGGRLHKLINILLNNCEYVDDRLVNEKRFQDAARSPAHASGLDLKRKFVAPLAKKVLNKVEDEEAAQSYKDDDPDSDDSEGMAM
eukprot:jgi/Undpi1/5637/HiC_scaffold_2.g00912.m1